MDNQSSLDRFLTAQEKKFPIALAEISGGRKQSHWMWYVFPQIAGLGISETSRFYALRDRSEAEEYIKHPVLGARLIEISKVVLGLKETNARTIFGSPDDLKLRSCMTLFAALKNSDEVFQKILDKYFNGLPDSKTLQILK